MTLDEFKKKISSPIIWGNLLAMIIIALLMLTGLWYWLSIYTRHGEQIEVPDVTGMVQSDAEYALEHVGLIPVVADSGYNKSRAAGSILDQQPVGGSIVKQDREIYLTINSNSCPTLPVPDIAENCSLREAEARLRGLGFKIGPTEYTEGDKDWVIKVKCRGRQVFAGERVPAEAPIVLVVGKGTEEDDNWEDSTEVTLDDMDIQETIVAE